jgi:hypothetical protein
LPPFIGNAEVKSVMTIPPSSHMHPITSTGKTLPSTNILVMSNDKNQVNKSLRLNIPIINKM